MKNLFLTTIICLLFSVSLSAQDLSEIYKQVNPAVVTIYTEQSNRVSDGVQLQKISGKSLGSGFMISDREIVTAAHVVNLAERVTISFSDGTSSPAKVITVHETADIALIKLIIPRFDPVTVPWGDSDALNIGERIFIVGAPLGLEHSLSSGYVSGKLKNIQGQNPFSRSEFIQTDAAINKGNSGGPMFNLKGEVVGVVSHIKTQSGGFEGIGFAASSNITKELLSQKTVLWNGMDSLPLSGDLAALFNVPQESGLLVEKLTSNSPLRDIGLRDGTIELSINKLTIIAGGDIILAVNNVPINFTDEGLVKLGSIAQDIGPNNTLELKILRRGKIMTLKR